MVGLPDAEPWITPEPPAVSTLPAEHAAPSGRRAYADPPPPAPTAEPPRVVHAAAMCGPTPAIAAIFALLDAQPNHGEWWTAAARAELRREGIAHPNRLDLAIRAAMILRRSNPDTETRPA